MDQFTIITELLTELLRNNQLGIDNHWPFAHRNLNMSTTDDDISSSDEGEMPSISDIARICSRPPMPSFSLPTDGELQKSYDNLQNDISVRCGFCGVTEQPKSSAGPLNSPSGSPLVNVLRRREMNDGRAGLFRTSSNVRIRPYTGGLTPAQRVFLNNRYLPNRRRKVDTIRSKTFCVAYIDDGEGIMTASQDHKIRLYRPSGRRRRYVLNKSLDVPYVGWSILDVTVSPDGRDVVYSTWNEAMYQCNIHDSDETWTPLPVDANDARFALFSMRFNSAGTEIVAGSTDRHLYIYSREANRCVLALVAHEDDINAVSFGDNESHIILSAGDDGLCKVWDRRTMGEYGGVRPVGVFAGHRDGITFIDSRGDDRYLLTNSKDQTIKLWDMRHFSSNNAIESTKTAVGKQTWDYRWQCCPVENFKTAPLEGDSSVMTLRGHSVIHTLIRARFSPDYTGKRYVYSGCGRGNCIVHDIYTGETTKVYGGHRSVVRDCMWHPHFNELVTSSWDGETTIWRYDEREMRNINPESISNTPGDEDSCDESYKPVTTYKIDKKKMLKLKRPFCEENKMQ